MSEFAEGGWVVRPVAASTTLRPGEYVFRASALTAETLRRVLPNPFEDES